MRYKGEDDFPEWEEVRLRDIGATFSGKIVRGLKINLPTREEQNKIDVILSRIEQKSTKESNKVRCLKDEKEGFLQKMFIY